MTEMGFDNVFKVSTPDVGTRRPAHGGLRVYLTGIVIYEVFVVGGGHAGTFLFCIPSAR